MPKRKEPELDPKEQWKRFKDAAKEHDVDQNEAAIEDVFKSISKKKSKRTNR